MLTGGTLEMRKGMHIAGIYNSDSKEHASQMLSTQIDFALFI